MSWSSATWTGNRDPKGHRSAYVVFGSDGGADEIHLLDLSLYRRFAIRAALGSDALITSMAGGDFNGDGISDVAVGIQTDSLFQQIVLVPGRRSEGEFTRGNANADGAVNIADAQFLLNVLFLGGPQPGCDDATDVNDDGQANIADAQYLLNFLFLGGAAPPEPFRERGIDPTPDGLGCRRSS